MKISSTTFAARSALSAIDDGTREVEEVARKVAGGIENPSGANTTEVSSALARLPELQQQASANAAVFDRAETLLQKLASLPRQ